MKALSLNQTPKEITDYNPRQIIQSKASKYTQTWGNCWLYATMNDLYDNTKIITDEYDFKLYIKAKKVNPEKSNTAYWWVSFMQKYMSDKKVNWYMFKIYDTEKKQLVNMWLLAKMLNAWYSLIYTRVNNTELLMDILKDDEVDFVRPKIGKNTGRHVSTFRLDKKTKKFTENGEWWDNNVFTEFTFDNSNLFLQCVKAGVIDDRVFFLDIN